MVGYWFTVLGRSIFASLAAIGQTWAGLLYLSTAIVVSLGLIRYSSGVTAMRQQALKIGIEVVAVAILSWIPFFLWQVAKMPLVMRDEAVVAARKEEQTAARSEIQKLENASTKRLADKDAIIAGLNERIGQGPAAAPGQSARTNQMIAVGLQRVFDEGQKLRNRFFNSDDSLSEAQSNAEFEAWRATLRDYIRQNISIGRAQYVDGVASVNSYSYGGMKSVTTRDRKETLITHIDVRLSRLSEIMKEY